MLSLDEESKKINFKKLTENHGSPILGLRNQAVRSGKYKPSIFIGSMSETTRFYIERNKVIELN